MLVRPVCDRKGIWLYWFTPRHIHLSIEESTYHTYSLWRTAAACPRCRDRNKEKVFFSDIYTNSLRVIE